MAEEKELQEKVLRYRRLEAMLNNLINQRELINSKILELQSTLASISEIEKSGEIIFPLGSEAYTLGKITKKDRIIVEIGANVALEKNIEEGKEFLNKRKTELENVLSESQRDVSEISMTMNELGFEIQRLTSEKNV